MRSNAEFWSTQKVAEHCGVTRKTVTRWVDAGVLPAIYTSGGHRRIRVVDVHAFMKNRRSLHDSSEVSVSRTCVVITRDSSVQRVVKRMARAWTHELQLVVASHGFEAGLAVAGEGPSLVLVDDDSDCDPAVIGRLLNAMNHLDATVVACLAHSSSARRAHLAVNGVAGVLRKPLAEDELRAVFLDFGLTPA